MAVFDLAGEPRKRTGKGGSRQVRRDGYIPAVLYGAQKEPAAIKIAAKAFDDLTRTPGGMHSVIDFKMSDRKEEVMALIRDVQRDPVSRAIIHVDFQMIEAGKPVDVVLPLHLTGVPVGVKLGGGILEHVTREIEVRCLPRNISGRFEIDVSALEVGDHLSVSDLTIPDVEILTDGSRTIALVAAPTVIEEPKAAEDEEAALAEGEGEDKDKAEAKSEDD